MRWNGLRNALGAPQNVLRTGLCVKFLFVALGAGVHGVQHAPRPEVHCREREALVGEDTLDHPSSGISKLPSKKTCSCKFWL